MRRYPPPIVHAPRNALPVLLSVPHSGRDYDPELLANAAQGRLALEPLEDPLVDRLVWRAIAAGTGAVIQPVPRAAIDCNRGEDEVDPAAIASVSGAPVGVRARHGLGLIASRTHRHGALWRRPIDRAELNRRIETVHRPYHRAIEQALDTLAIAHGEALLIDCHSMPPRAQGQADIVIGDLHGRSAAGWLGDEAAAIARAQGFRVARNDPYAGGAIIARHGRPPDGIHALQLEIDRAAYLGRDLRTPGPGFDRVAILIEAMAQGLDRALLGRAMRDAAE
ncbi:MAG: N-formylglutamate amidohydrolase [Sphingomicrobium sp.]